MMQKIEKIIPLLFYCLVIIYVVGTVWVVNRQLNGFLYSSGDTAVAEQALWNTLHGEWFKQSFLPVSNNFHEHLNFIQLLYLPAYALHPTTQTLYLIIQLSYATVAVLLYRYCAKKIDPSVALVFGVCFLFNPITILQSIDTFHVVAVAAPLLLVTLLFYIEQRWNYWLGALTILALTSEFIAPTIIMLGVVAFLQKRSWKWIIPPVFMGSSVMIAASIFITVGYSSIQALVTAVSNFDIWQQSLSKRLLVTERLLRSWIYILPWLSLYSLLLLPNLLLVLVIIAVSRLQINSHLFSLIPVIVLIALLDYYQKTTTLFRRLVLAGMLVGLIVSVPIWLNKVDLQPSLQAKEMMAAIELVPASSSVTASRSLSYGLSRRSDFYLIDNKKFTDYVVIDTKSYEYKDPRYQEYLASITTSETYSQIYKKNHIQVYINLSSDAPGSSNIPH